MEVILIICDILLVIAILLNFYTLYHGIKNKSLYGIIMGILGIGVCLWSLLL